MEHLVTTKKKSIPGSSLSSVLRTSNKPSLKGGAGTIAGIVLAIIGIIATALVGAEAIVMRELNKAKQLGAKISGGLLNRSQWGWKPMKDTSLPYHGHWGSAPRYVDSLVTTMSVIASELIRTRREGNELHEADPNYPTSQEEFESDLLDAYNKATEENSNIEEKEISVISLMGDNMGGESLAMYSFVPTDEYSTSNDSWNIALYLKKKPGGHYYAGALICTQNWLDTCGLDYSGKGKDFFEFLRDHPSNVPGFVVNSCSSGESDSISMDINYVLDIDLDETEKLSFRVDSTLTISFCGGEMVNFDIEQTINSLEQING